MSTDKYVWLEKNSLEVDDWVEFQHQQISREIFAKPEYKANYDKAMEVSQLPEAISIGNIRGQYIYNYIKTPKNPSGILRRAEINEYLKGNKKWINSIVFDNLNGIQEVSLKGFVPHPDDSNRCLLYLSKSNADSYECFEFDYLQDRLVENGFHVETGKSKTIWLDTDRILVAYNNVNEHSIFIFSRNYENFVRDCVFKVESDSLGIDVDCCSIDAGKEVILVSVCIDFFKTEYWIVDGLNKIPIDLPHIAVFIGFFKNRLIFTLNKKIIALNTSQVLIREHIAEEILYTCDEYQNLDQVCCLKDYVFINIKKDLYNNIYILQAYPRLEVAKIRLPAEGKLWIQSYSRDTNYIFISYEDFVTPKKVFIFDGPVCMTKEEKPVTSQNEPMVTKKILVEKDADGFKCAYFLIHNKNIEYNGKNPTILFGYGGFGFPAGPNYSAYIDHLWLRKGGVYAYAILHGDGAYGDHWHRVSTKRNKCKTFKDFIKVAHDLIDRNITSPDFLALRGGSNGALTAAVALVKEPQLFKAAVCAVPILDMLNFHTLYNGSDWIAEYGNPEDDDDKEYLRSYSPYHNVVPEVPYPEVLFMTSKLDDRVHPAHARKMAAKMLEFNQKVLFYENREGGHSGASNFHNRLEWIALEYTFFQLKLLAEKENNQKR